MVKNTIFNQKRIDEFIKRYDNKLTIHSPQDKPVEAWIQLLDNGLLVDEKSNYKNFSSVILQRLLGYKAEDYLFEHSFNGRPVEYTLLRNDKLYVVVELKGTLTKELDKRYNRNQSAIEQATNYASVYKETEWAIVSNYDEFRLFNPNSKESYISFKFKELEDPYVLKEFLLIFSKFSLIEENIPLKLLNETKNLEKDFEKEFYELYNETRLMLIKELKNSPQALTKEDNIRYAQLILNRYIFICFAEDFGYIPAETSTKTILTPIENNNLFDYTVWDRINELFRFVDKGNPEKGINSFNGGLFKENLRNLEIRDKLDDTAFFDECKKEWSFKENYNEISKLLGDYVNTLNPIYKNMLIMSAFNFSTEVDVNILGHIFEKSIEDIENLKSRESAKKKSKRKKDGIYYTPEYITDFICKNTIISYLSKSGLCKTVDELISEYNASVEGLEKLDNKLKNIKIIDPSCGSGAFLNKATDILLEIHEAIHNEKYLDDNTLDKWFDSLSERKKILKHNIYGVDLNKESVEITKLAMFLKVANRESKLPNLDDNIKCGNSIIHDENITENPFNWKEEFREVFSEGGFDIVIGNPPYGAKLSQTEKKYLNKTYIKGGSETAISFIKLSFDNLIKDNGIVGFIIPKAFTYASNYRHVREETLEKIDTIIDCKKVWKEVKLEQMVIILNKDKKDECFNLGIRCNRKLLIQDRIPTKIYDDFEVIPNNISLDDLNLAYKIKKSGTYLNDISRNKRGDNFQKHGTSIGEVEFIGGAEIQREGICGIKGRVNKEKVKKIEQSIIKNNSVLVQRIVSQLEKPVDHLKITACIPNTDKLLICDTINQIQIDKEYDKYLIWSLLNSKIINWYSYRFIFAKAIRTIQFDNPTTSKIPMPTKLKEDESPVVKEIISKSVVLEEKYHKRVDSKNNICKALVNNFDGIKVNKKLKNFEELDFKQFKKEINDQKFKISLDEQEEWMTYFDKYKRIVKGLQQQEGKLEDEINQLIYKLYDLNEHDIEIIENSFKG